MKVMYRWFAVATVALGLVVLGRSETASRATSPRSYETLLVQGQGSACPAPLLRAPSWTTEPGASLVPMIAVGGHGYVDDVDRRPVFFGLWTQDDWTFQMVNMNVYGWSPYAVPLYAALQGDSLPGVGVVRATFTGHGVVYRISWRAHGSCRSAEMRGDPQRVAEWIAARARA